MKPYLRALGRSCPLHGDSAVSNPARWLSLHRTSDGIVVYYRCDCGRPRVAGRAVMRRRTRMIPAVAPLMMAK